MCAPASTLFAGPVKLTSHAAKHFLDVQLSAPLGAYQFYLLIVN